MTSPNASETTNPLKTRADFQQFARELFEPLVPHFEASPGRPKFGPTAAGLDAAAEGLESFSRPLWGIAALAAGGGEFAHWDLVRRGLVAGTDPNSPEYWGVVGAPPGTDASADQRLVEMAAIGFALAIAPEHIYEPLSQQEKDNVVRWLSQINQTDTNPNNWWFFRIMVDAGLEKVGAPFNEKAAQESFNILNGYYLGDGWYRDGALQNTDFYVAFAFHFYSLIYARLRGDKDPERAHTAVGRARAFASDWAARFDATGRVIAYGRSLTYRSGGAAFFGALAFADVEALPWAEIRALWAKHLRWFAKQDIYTPDGVLSIGWAYPNLLMSETYNSPGSPYWALKALLPLALPEDHPFWTAEENPDAGSTPLVSAQPHAQVVVNRTDNQSQMLNAGGNGAWFVRQAVAKYGKLAYSSAFPLALEPDDIASYLTAESELAFVDVMTMRRETRRLVTDSGLTDPDDTIAWSKWEAFGEDIRVTTFMRGEGDAHVRVHVVDTDLAVTAVEGGFAIAENFDPAHNHYSEDSEDTHARVRNGKATSLLVDLAGERAASTSSLQPNTSLGWARATVPLLTQPLTPDQHVLVTGVRAAEEPDLSFEHTHLLDDAFATAIRDIAGVNLPKTGD
ncbi:DUF2264 domain-containing protein [Corynebacterium massiliense]|uniref:DUF2264 domain-containing protein n=1 Tax=Corynebacterium massiliense TaxID=441501 RepID=UPI0023556B1A|nr:DUF2264 domain-containing protein [Corynebacterium massiliense]